MCKVKEVIPMREKRDGSISYYEVPLCLTNVFRGVYCKHCDHVVVSLIYWTVDDCWRNNGGKGISTEPMVIYAQYCPLCGRRIDDGEKTDD